MNSEFYSKVADRFGGYSSGAKRIEVFPDGDPEDAFDVVTSRRGPLFTREYLHMVPIFEDYDSEVDGELFSRYVARASSDRGVRLGRHWFLLHVRKPASASRS